MYTVNEAAEELKLDPSHVRLLLRSGKLKGVKQGRDWMIPDLDYRRKRGCKRKIRPAFKESLKDHVDCNKAEIIALLKETPILKGVSSSELMMLAENGSKLHFNKQQTIIMAEDKADFCYIILNGFVKISITSPSGRELLVDVIDRGKVFGIGSLVPGNLHPNAIQAIGNADVVSIPKNIFRDFTARNSEVMTKIVELDVARISDLFAKLIGLLTDKTDQRVRNILNELRIKFGDVLPFTHKEIAEMSGSTNETVTRILVKLKKQGVLKIQRGSIQVTDAKKLLL